MKPDTAPIAKLIGSSVAKLAKRSEFTDWVGSQATSNGDLIAINNSFIFRDKTSIKTRKNNQFLCLRVAKGKIGAAPLVADFSDFNLDFKLLVAQSKNLPKTEALGPRVTSELKGLGQLVFVLIGEIKDQRQSCELGHAYAAELRFDPGAAGSSVEEFDGNRRLIINQLLDPETAWNEIEAQVKGDVKEGLEALSESFAIAFEKLRDETTSKLHLPKPGTGASKASFVSKLREALAEQRKLYDQALARYQQEGKNPVHLNEVLRIAYNFADDALKVLQLLVSIADLKAIVLWCTIDEHFALATAFRNLPWSKTTKKPSLSKYQDVIAGARNRAFHNLLAFDRTIESDLAGVAINARTLTLFPAHGRRKGTVPFDYEDRELVEVLSELTLAPETIVSLDFWKRNADVMRCFENLIVRTEEALGLLNKTRA